MHGLPLAIHTDYGTQFCNDMVNSSIDELLKLVNVAHTYSYPYHPESNGICERTNREVVRHLRMLCLLFDKYNKRTEVLPIVQFIINNSVHSAIGVSPYVMVHGDINFCQIMDCQY